MKVLVTGTSGQLGYDVMEELKFQKEVILSQYRVKQ